VSTPNGFIGGNLSPKTRVGVEAFSKTVFSSLSLSGLAGAVQWRFFRAKSTAEVTRFFYNRTHFFYFLAHFKGFFDFFFHFLSPIKKIVLSY